MNNNIEDNYGNCNECGNFLSKCDMIESSDCDGETGEHYVVWICRECINELIKGGFCGKSYRR